MKQLIKFGTLGSLVAMLSGCSDHQPPVELDYTGWVPQAAMDSVRGDNQRLVNALAFTEYKLNECEGPDALLTKAKYHIARGEHSKAKPLLSEAASKGDVHAKTAADLERSMTATSSEKVSVTSVNENIITVDDDADGIKWYYDRRVPRSLDTTAFYLYIGHKVTGAPWLRMRSQYAGDGWLFINKVRIHAGNLQFIRETDPLLMFSHASDLTVTEWNDEPPSREDLRVIKQVIGSPDAEITFIGRTREYTHRITDDEREAFINILEYYRRMGSSEEAAAM